MDRCCWWKTQRSPMHWCIPPSGCNSGIRDKHKGNNWVCSGKDSATDRFCNLSFGKTQLWVTLCKTTCLSYCGLQVKHRAQPRAEHQGCVGEVWPLWNPNQSSLFSKGRLSVALSISLSTWCTLIFPGRHSGAAKEMPEVQGQYWYPDFSMHWQWHQLFAAELEPHSRESSDSPGDKGSPHRTAASRARKHSWDQVHHSNSRNYFSFRDYDIMQLITFSFEKGTFQTFLSVCAISWAPLKQHY